MSANQWLLYASFMTVSSLPVSLLSPSVYGYVLLIASVQLTPCSFDVRYGVFVSVRWKGDPSERG